MSAAEKTPDTTPGGAHADLRDQVVALFAAAIDSDPAYAPSVIRGDDTVQEWFDRKRPEWTKVVVSNAYGVVGHVAVQERRELPEGSALPARHDRELCRLTVHPDHRRRGLANRLVRLAHARYGPRLWATCQVGGASHILLLNLGWTPYRLVAWYDDPLPGIALLAPTTLRKDHP